MRTLTALAFAIASLAAAGTAAAQSCGSPTVVPQPPGAVPPAVFNVNTCTSTNTLTDVCNGSLPVPGQDVAFSFNLTAGNNPAFSVAPTGYDASLFLLQTTCAASANCAQAAESGGSGVTETIPAAAYAAGAYFLVVDSFSAVGGCGASVITVTGPLPVELQQFSVD